MYPKSDLEECKKECLSYRPGYWVIWEDTKSCKYLGMAVFKLEGKAFYWNERNNPCNFLDYEFNQSHVMELR